MQIPFVRKSQRVYITSFLFVNVFGKIHTRTRIRNKMTASLDSARSELANHFLKRSADMWLGYKW
jgi:hypothetical protein